jgi:kynureninase
MIATYDAGEGEPKGRGRVNGYGRENAMAAAEAAVKAVDDWRAKTQRSVANAEEDWATLDKCVVGRIGRNKFAVVFIGTIA